MTLKSTNALICLLHYRYCASQQVGFVHKTIDFLFKILMKFVQGLAAEVYYGEERSEQLENVGTNDIALNIFDGSAI